MTIMKIGLKCFPDEYDDGLRIRSARLTGYDYIELQVMPEFLGDKRNGHKRVPATCLDNVAKFVEENKDDVSKSIRAIHSAHHMCGINFADPYKTKKNLDSLELSVKAADITGADYIVVHPGYFDPKNPECNIDNCVEFLKEIDDKRVIVENVPCITKCNPKRWIKNLDEIKDFYDRIGKEACLDLSHAVVNALNIKTDVKDYVIGMYEYLKPKYFHVNDIKHGEVNDTHDHIGTGQVPIDMFFRSIHKDSMVTIETDYTSQEDLDLSREKSVSKCIWIFG